MSLVSFLPYNYLLSPLFHYSSLPELPSFLFLTLFYFPVSHYYYFFFFLLLICFLIPPASIIILFPLFISPSPLYIFVYFLLLLFVSLSQTVAANRKSLRRHQRESKRHSVLAAEIATGKSAPFIRMLLSSVSFLVYSTSLYACLLAFILATLLFFLLTSLPPFVPSSLHSFIHSFKSHSLPLLPSISTRSPWLP